MTQGTAVKLESHSPGVMTGASGWTAKSYGNDRVVVVVVEGGGCVVEGATMVVVVAVGDVVVVVGAAASPAQAAIANVTASNADIRLMASSSGSQPMRRGFWV